MPKIPRKIQDIGWYKVLYFDMSSPALIEYDGISSARIFEVFFQNVPSFSACVVMC